MSLIVVAFNEKLANLPFAEAFIRAYPLNFTSELMFPFSLTDEFFSRLGRWDGAADRAILALQHLYA